MPTHELGRLASRKSSQVVVTCMQQKQDSVGVSSSDGAARYIILAVFFVLLENSVLSQTQWNDIQSDRLVGSCVWLSVYIAAVLLWCLAHLAVRSGHAQSKLQLVLYAAVSFQLQE